MQAYCMKCRAKREMKDAKAITMKNGKPASRGITAQKEAQEQDVRSQKGS